MPGLLVVGGITMCYKEPMRAKTLAMASLLSLSLAPILGFIISFIVEFTVFYENETLYNLHLERSFGTDVLSYASLILPAFGINLLIFELTRPKPYPHSITVWLVRALVFLFSGGFLPFIALRRF